MFVFVSPPKNRRTVQRRSPAIASIAILTDKGERVICHFKNQSILGMAFLSPHRFEVGTTIQIEVPSATFEGTHLLKAKVKHSTAHGRRNWFVGCSFLRKLK
ncbi:hypothetical protein BH10PLA2_BH10PLA2_30060 [soil metagenome]